MSRLLGHHAMQLGNTDHITGKFNPHLETLLRVTADEALFVGDPRHRNALFGLITEPTLTIEPKGCGVYAAPNYLNVTILSNSEHFIPISSTARRFFVPTVSIARLGDHDYFAGLQTELDHAATRHCSITCCRRLTSPASMSARCRRPRRCGSSATRACRRWKSGGANCWSPVRYGGLIQDRPTVRSATAIRGLSRSKRFLTAPPLANNRGSSLSWECSIRPGRSSRGYEITPATTRSGGS